MANWSPFPHRTAVYRILKRNNSRLLNEMMLYFDIKNINKLRTDVPLWSTKTSSVDVRAPGKSKNEHS